MRWTQLLALSAFALLGSCDDERESPIDPAARACVRSHPADALANARALADGSATLGCLDQHERCEAGSACRDTVATCEVDSESLIAAEAARCLASAAGLAPGLSELTTALVYEPTHRRFAWSVSNVERSEARGSRGRCMLVDALSGALLERCDWVQED